MIFSVCTLFPQMFDGFFSCGILGKAVTSEIIRLETVDIREFAEDRHRTADDRPFGGGSGMVMKPEPLSRAIDQAREDHPEAPVVLLSPQGREFCQETARFLSAFPALILVCGRYEGVDERISASRADYEISVGDYILTGGEPAAMVVMDAVSRLLPGVLGNQESAETESFETGLLEHAHFTRPREFEGEEVPEVLLSGHHREIQAWREETALLRTVARRPDLVEVKELSAREMAMLEKWGRVIEGIVGSKRVRRALAPSGDEQAGG